MPTWIGIISTASEPGTSVVAAIKALSDEAP